MFHRKKALNQAYIQRNSTLLIIRSIHVSIIKWKQYDYDQFTQRYELLYCAIQWIPYSAVKYHGMVMASSTRHIYQAIKEGHSWSTWTRPTQYSSTSHWNWMVLTGWGLSFFGSPRIYFPSSRRQRIRRWQTSPLKRKLTENFFSSSPCSLRRTTNAPSFTKHKKMHWYLMMCLHIS